MTTEELLKLNRKPYNDEVGCLVCGKETGGFTVCVECGVDAFVDGKSVMDLLKEKDLIRHQLLVHYTRSDVAFAIIVAPNDEWSVATYPK